MKNKNKAYTDNYKQYISPALKAYPALSELSSLTGMQAIIHDRIWDSIINGELKPGAKVPELQIGEAFSVSRTIVRNVLIVMEQEELITLPPNRGAYIAIHTPEQIEQAFESVNLTMKYIIQQLSENPAAISAKDRQKIEAHLNYELPDDLNHNQRSHMRFGMEFIALLCAIYNNKMLLKFAERVCSIIMIASANFQQKLIMWPEKKKQEQIINAIYAGKAVEGISAFESYMKPLQNSFNFDVQEQNKDIYSVISSLSDGLNLQKPIRHRNISKKK
ncbi:GntR family transcriptional regulator [Microvirga sp. W0021]|uniref:GntR family transcriptional regulator n=1 Tax=Hohaiivirga grylli TaxID=3133970 RepID=A0ABV0BFU0_9HYPH